MKPCVLSFLEDKVPSKDFFLSIRRISIQRKLSSARGRVCVAQTSFYERSVGEIIHKLSRYIQFFRDSTLLVLLPGRGYFFVTTTHCFGIMDLDYLPCSKMYQKWKNTHGRSIFLKCSHILSYILNEVFPIVSFIQLHHATHLISVSFIAFATISFLSRILLSAWWWMSRFWPFSYEDEIADRTWSRLQRKWQQAKRVRIEQWSANSGSCWDTTSLWLLSQHDKQLYKLRSWNPWGLFQQQPVRNWATTVYDRYVYIYHHDLMKKLKNESFNIFFRHPSLWSYH